MWGVGNSKNTLETLKMYVIHKVFMCAALHIYSGICDLYFLVTVVTGENLSVSRTYFMCLKIPQTNIRFTVL